MKNIFNVLIIGLGRIGLEYDYNKGPKFLLSHSSSFFYNKNFNLVGAVDIDKRKCIKFENSFNKPAYDNLKLALKDVQPEIIVISTPTDTLIEVFENILQLYKPKVVLIEKPISLDYEVAKKVVNKAKLSEISLFVNYMRRSEPYANKIKTKIETINSFAHGVCWYSRGIYNGASHFINLLQYWFGDFENCNVIDNGNLYNPNDPEPAFEIELKNGSFKFFPITNKSIFHNSIDIIHSDGRIKYEFNGRIIYCYDANFDNIYKNYKVFDLTPIKYEIDFSSIQSKVVENLYLFLKGKEFSLCSGSEALKTLEVIESIRKKRNEKFK